VGVGGVKKLKMKNEKCGMRKGIQEIRNREMKKGIRIFRISYFQCRCEGELAVFACSLRRAA
jgi:hypothetical protein